MRIVVCYQNKQFIARNNMPYNQSAYTTADTDNSSASAWAADTETTIDDKTFS